MRTTVPELQTLNANTIFSIVEMIQSKEHFKAFPNRNSDEKVEQRTSKMTQFFPHCSHKPLYLKVQLIKHYLTSES